ncbi:hypothetical protein CN212_29760 [Sinorhizobium meliloti]|nr:hypothetical protein CN220_11835 [Sinorhizobium meliloti]RVH41896.1 hypothetical protein CN212_29760 [Sinorhizobium meliloti]
MIKLAILPFPTAILAASIFSAPVAALAGGSYYRGVASEPINIGHNMNSPTQKNSLRAKVVANRSFPKRGAYYKGIMRNEQP